MMRTSKKDKPILKASAFLWDGNKQLSGELTLFQDAVYFNFNDFSKSQMELNIPITKINHVEEFLLFDLERKGLKIKSNAHAEDVFILESPQLFKKEIEKIINQKNEL